MLTSLWHAGTTACGYVRRHKKIVIIGGIVVSAATVYYGMRKVIEEAEKLAEEFDLQLAQDKLASEAQRKEIHITRSKQECEAAVYRFLPTFRKKLYEQLDMDEVIAKVKTLNAADREERNLLWEELKVLGLARYLAGVYAFCLLHTLVHIQLHIIGRQSYQQAKAKLTSAAAAAAPDSPTSSTTDSCPTEEARREVLGSTIEYFLNEGLPMLIQYTKDAVEKDVSVMEWKVIEKTQVDQTDFLAVLKRVHEFIIPTANGMEEGMATGMDVATNTNEAKVSNWRAFIMYSEVKGDSASPETLAILNEIWGILDTDLYTQVLHESLNCCFENICRDLSKGIFHQGMETPPLAKVIPRMKYEVNQLFSGKSNAVRKRYCTTLAELHTLQGLCRGIFFK